MFISSHQKGQISSNHPNYLLVWSEQFSLWDSPSKESTHGRGDTQINHFLINVIARQSWSHYQANRQGVSILPTLMSHFSLGMYSAFLHTDLDQIDTRQSTVIGAWLIKHETLLGLQLSEVFSKFISLKLLNNNAVYLKQWPHYFYLETKAVPLCKVHGQLFGAGAAVKEEAVAQFPVLWTRLLC